MSTVEIRAEIDHYLSLIKDESFLKVGPFYAKYLC